MSAPSRLQSRQVNPYLAIPEPPLLSRLRQWRDEQLLRKALLHANDPGLVLDLPCDAGRFWSVLAEKDSRIIVAADQSAESIQAVCAGQNPELTRRIMPLQTPYLDIDLPDNCVDCILCIDLFTQVRDSMLRMELLQEFHRVTRQTVIVSTCTDGNLAAWQERYLPDRDAETDSYVIIPRSRIEKEFTAAGFNILQRLDFAPLLSMQRLYVLEKEQPSSA